MATNNPIIKLFQNKTFHVTLPSKGRSEYYPSGITLAADGELAIYPMTIQNELRLKSPDFLFSGDALIDVLATCTPTIANPQEIPSCDLDVIMLGIRHITYGNIAEISVDCTECKTNGVYEIKIDDLINSQLPVEENNKIILPTNDETIKEIEVSLRPSSLANKIKEQIRQFKIANAQQIFENDDQENTATDEQKKEIYTNLITELETSIVDIMVDNILKINIADKTITDKEIIKEWINTIETVSYHKLQNKINELNTCNLDDTKTIQCGNCQTEFETPIILNPMNFFLHN